MRSASSGQRQIRLSTSTGPRHSGSRCRTFGLRSGPFSLRLPESMIAELKLLANQRDVPYQSLLKVFLADRISQERARPNGERKTAARKRAG